MGELVLELKGKLAKSRPRAMLFAALCSDNKFVAKVLNEFPFASVQKELAKSVEVSSDELENIAHYAILALKDIPAGKGLDSVKKARPFIEDIASLMNESKDKLELEDYCHAILAVRELQTLVLPKDLVLSPKEQEERVKTFKLQKPAEKTTEEKKSNFLSADLEKAGKWVDEFSTKGDLTELIEGRDRDMVACAKNISTRIEKDGFLKKKYGAHKTTFSNWVAEQLYGYRPETVEAIKAIQLDEGLLADLFNQFIQNLAATDPNKFIKALALIVDVNDIDNFVDNRLLPAVVLSEQVKNGNEPYCPIEEKDSTNPFDLRSIVRKSMQRSLADRGQRINMRIDSRKSSTVDDDAASWWDRHLENAHRGTTRSLEREKKVAAV